MEASSISKNTIVEGRIETTDLLKIDGTFKGENIKTNKIIAGKDAIIEANIQVENISIAGKIIGNIVASKSVDISQIGSVVGNITSPILNMAPGCKFKGNCTITVDENKSNDD